MICQETWRLTGNKIEPGGRCARLEKQKPKIVYDAMTTQRQRMKGARLLEPGMMFTSKKLRKKAITPAQAAIPLNTIKPFGGIMSLTFLRRTMKWAPLRMKLNVRSAIPMNPMRSECSITTLKKLPVKPAIFPGLPASPTQVGTRMERGVDTAALMNTVR